MKTLVLKSNLISSEGNPITYINMLIKHEIPIFFEDDSSPFHRLLNELIFLEMNLDTALSMPPANSWQSITGVMSALNNVIGLMIAYKRIRYNFQQIDQRF